MKNDDEPNIMDILDDLYSGKDMSKHYPEKNNKNPLSIPIEHAELLIAAYYSEREKIQGKLETIIDLKQCCYGFEFEITPRDILIMHRDALYGMNRKKKKYKHAIETLKNYRNIGQSIFNETLSTMTMFHRRQADIRFANVSTLMSR